MMSTEGTVFKAEKYIFSLLEAVLQNKYK